jgi:hypothetical protein
VKRHVAAILLCVSIARTAHGASIGLFADPDYTSCNLDIPAPPGYSNLYVVALDCANIVGVCPGFTGAAFRIEGLPTGWLTTVVPAAGVHAVGSLFGSGGGLFFDESQSSDRILLCTVVVFPASPGASAVLRVTVTAPPSRPDYPCPLAYVGDCPGPIFTCVEGGTLFVNSEVACTVATVPSTWTIMKRLFH